MVDNSSITDVIPVVTKRLLMDKAWLSVLVVVLGHLGGSIWWASGITSDVRSLASRQLAYEMSFKDLSEKTSNLRADTSAMRESLSNLKDAANRIERKLDDKKRGD